MSLPPATIAARFYAVLKTDSGGLAVRAALGDGATSVIQADDLNKASLPATPFIVLKWGTGGGSRAGLQRFLPTWWVYDTMGLRWQRIEPLIELIKAAYPQLALASCEIDFLSDSGRITDAALNLRAKSQPFVLVTR